ncbi:MAG: DUF362 domain-containing protein [Candidatus Thorarchaeota archaeon]|jgi:uncharacterized protein (DUF362 family)
MSTTVAVVDSLSFIKALSLIRGIDDLNTPEKDLIIKVGIFDPTTRICTTSRIIDSIAHTFDKSPSVRVTESDSGAGPGMERLRIWTDCYNHRVTPFNLSDDVDTREVVIAGETVPFSHVLFKPKTFISTHVPRRYEKAGKLNWMNIGSIIKNLLGLILDKNKVRFHDRLPHALLDMYEAIGGIDLAVQDATRVYLGFGKRRAIVSTDLVLVGRDAFAVEAVGLYMVGLEPKNNPVLQEARSRGLGVVDLNKIEIIGDVDTARDKIIKEFNALST